MAVQMSAYQQLLMNCHKKNYDSIDQNIIIEFY